ncbi:MAG: NUDIX domain-containing protein, partial [Micromonosporaceae bacterium]|nr:NUDIX domain-containing protein [Micromonosporaceae bacterium]
DPARPQAWYWFTVGGGIDPGETARQAAARELREETGLSIPEEALGEPVWREVTEFGFDGRRYRQDQEFFLFRTACFEIDTDGWDEVERRTVNAIRWWAAHELERSDEVFHPRDLPALLRRVLTEGAA